MSGLISGDAGRICFLIKGEYRADSMYDFLDVVHYEGSSYVAKKKTTGNPPADNNEFWQILASKGDSASVSVTGVKGEAETEYRRGNVNITKGNIGLSNVANERQYSESNPQKNVTGSSGSCTGNSATATKATQDAVGNVITDTYAKKLIYNDTTVNMGRKSGTSVGSRSFSFGNNVEASGSESFSEGLETIASGYISHAEGWKSTASGPRSHAEGYNTKASGYNSHSGGHLSEAKGVNSLAYGLGVIAGAFGQLAIGWYNVDENNPEGYTNPFVIGNGNNENARSNAFRVNKSGSVYGKAEYNSSGADYAEFIRPWADGNPYNEDRVGYFVTVKKGYLYKAEAGEYIVGITSGNPSVVGNSDEEYYWRWERDEFNRIVYEEVSEYIEKIDENGIPVMDEDGYPVMVESGRFIESMKQREDYDIYLQNSYVERKNRKEWDYVGMVGVVPVRDDGTCIVGRYCRCGTGGIATFSESRGFDTYMVLDRVTDSVVSVILK